MISIDIGSFLKIYLLVSNIPSKSVSYMFYKKI